MRALSVPVWAVCVCVCCLGAGRTAPCPHRTRVTVPAVHRTVVHGQDKHCAGRECWWVVGGLHGV